jgi:(1->4)-alpha-D-glucan 1-alpha-D-glucosylmutase
MEKATKEAQVYTSWINPNAGFDEGLRNFICRLLTHDARNRFLPDFLQFQDVTAFAGIMNSLSQTLLKIAAPGVPDIYQGTEIWAFSLVDPDNRRLVDYERRRNMLASLDRDEAQDRNRLLAHMLSSPADGRLKMHVTSRALRLRRAHKELFSYGSYEAISVEGRKSEHAVAFARRHAGETVIAAAGRFFLKLGARAEPPIGTRFWEKTVLLVPDAPARLRDVFTGRVLEPSETKGSRFLPLEALFNSLPVALLISLNG